MDLQLTLNALLFDEHIVQIDSRSREVAGSWAGPLREGKPVAWEEPALRFFAQRLREVENPVMLDIGANTGSYCMLPLVCEGASCIAFEPAPYSFEILESNLAANELSDCVKAYQLAIADYNGESTLKYPQSESGLACLGTPKRFAEWEDVQVSVRSLDDLLPELGVQNIDFLKIDTEGCEKFVLLGGEQTIKDYKPNIFLEVNPQNTSQFAYDAREILHLLVRWGYVGRQLDAENFYFTFNPKLQKILDNHSVENVLEIAELTKIAAGGRRQLQNEELNIAVALTEYGYTVQITEEPEVIDFIEKRLPGVFSFKPTQFVFDSPPAEAINRARLDHLASLELPLENSRVLEVGAGVGKLSPFFLDRGCEIVATEARQINVDEHKRRFPNREVHLLDLNQPGVHTPLGQFDVVFCYGTLYHLSKPGQALAELSILCKEIFLLETCVHHVDNGQLNPVRENSVLLDQSISGQGCRPARNWVMSELEKHFEHVYITGTQPDHADYPATWPAPQGQLSRAVFVASRRELNLEGLSQILFSL